MTQQGCLKLIMIIILNNHSYSAQRALSNVFNATNITWRIYLTEKIFLKMRTSGTWHLLSLVWLYTNGWQSSTDGQKNRVCSGVFCSTNRIFRPGAPGSIWLISYKCFPKVSSLPMSCVWALTCRNASPSMISPSSVVRRHLTWDALLSMHWLYPEANALWPGQFFFKCGLTCLLNCLL